MIVSDLTGLGIEPQVCGKDSDGFKFNHYANQALTQIVKIKQFAEIKRLYSFHRMLKQCRCIYSKNASLNAKL